VPENRPAYVENLSVRPIWWVVALGVATLAAGELAAGFDWRVGLLALLATVLPTVAILGGIGRLSLRVDETGFTAGGRTLAFEDMESVEALDRERTRERIGPAADPAAHLVYRGYVAESVLIRPLDATATPYWLVSTRRPQQVVAAVEQAARAHFHARP
jgi:hypothetical protein